MNFKRANSRHHATLLQLSRRWWAAPAAFLVTLLALPVNAAVIGIPDVPLTTGSRVAPNILFILDNSGSMQGDAMPDSVPSTGTPEVKYLAYPRNTLSYNPAVTYLAWMQANGTRMTGGTSYTLAYNDDQRVNVGNTDLSSSPKTFYVPKDTTDTSETNVGNGANYYRFQILAGGSDIKRGVWGDIVVEHDRGVDGNYPDSGTADSSVVKNYTHSVVAGRRLEIQIQNRTSGSGTRNLNYWIYNPSGTQIASGTVTEGNSNYETIEPAVAGKYRIDLQRANSNNISFRIYADSYGADNRCSGETGNDGDKGWIDCVSALPNTSRDLAAELTNYATWYSYYRTRMKAAKAGAAEAFKSVGYKSRVGFRTISQGNTDAIPVGTNDGRFGDNPATDADEGGNRIAWYDSLFAATGNSYTPLRSALRYAGEYFSGTSATGAYGPEVGTAQLSCRQNFAILTTDGYWNTDTETGSPGSIGNADNANGSTITGPKSQSYQYIAQAPYSGSTSTTLADIAMYYWKRDLRTDTSFGKASSLDNNVPVTAGDPAFWQHMVTFGISIGMKGTVDQTSVSKVLEDGAPKKNGVVIAWPDPTDTENAERIDDLLHAAVNGHGAFVAASSPAVFAAGLRAALSAIDQRTSSYSNVATNSVSLDSGAQVFNASYTAGVWTGAVNARGVSDAGVSDTISWSASIPASGRNVWTSNGTSLVSFLTSTQATALARPAGAAELYPVSSTDNAAYINGDQSNEESNGGTLRNRNSLLGDIVGSSPAYVKDTNTLYVGANDGMLHAFSAADGNEVFAYIPDIIDWSALKSYSSGEYSHRFFVDGPIVVSSKSLTANKNILVGALGKGGTGLYALDVTNPASPAFQWEMKDTPTAGSMGKVLGKPVLGNVKGSASAIIGNGVDSTGNQAALIIIKGIDTASPTTIVVPAGTDGTATSPNALFAPTAVLGKDGKTVATVYAGDMLGNLWKFDLTTDTPTVKKLFAAGSTKPITGGVTVAVHPTTNKRWVFFGTGRFLIDADLTNTATQSMYGIIDEDVLVADSALDVQDSPVVSGDTRTFQSKTALLTGKKGWRVDLPVSGERIVQDMQVVSTFLVSASMIPSGDACGADGRGYINALDAFTGTSAGGSYFDLDGDPATDDQVGGVPVGSVDVGNGMPTLPNLLRGLIVVGGTGGSELRTRKTLSPRWDRLSWREIRQD